MKSTIIKPINSLNLLSRESLLKANSELIEKLQDRIRAKRFRPQEGDLIKIQYIKTLILSLKFANDLLNDIQLEEFDKRLKAVEEVYDVGPVLEDKQAGSLTEDRSYNSNLKGSRPGNISDLEEQDELTEDTWTL